MQAPWWALRAGLAGGLLLLTLLVRRAIAEEPSDIPERGRQTVSRPTPFPRARAEDLAQRTGVPLNVIAAIAAVESGPGGDQAVRFEPHKFLEARPDLWARIPYTPHGTGERVRTKKGLTAALDLRKRWSLVASETNRSAFARAFALDPKRSVEATSWGRYQVLGGYGIEWTGDADAFVTNFDIQPGPVSDILFAAWMQNHPAALSAARNADFEGFARVYNGPGQAAEYARRMEDAFRGGAIA